MWYLLLFDSRTLKEVFCYCRRQGHEFALQQRVFHHGCKEKHFFHFVFLFYSTLNKKNQRGALLILTKNGYFGNMEWFNSQWLRVREWNASNIHWMGDDAFQLHEVLSRSKSEWRSTETHRKSKSFTELTSLSWSCTRAKSAGGTCPFCWEEKTNFSDEARFIHRTSFLPVTYSFKWKNTNTTTLKNNT